MPRRAKRNSPASESQWELTQRPLQSLWFLLPLILFYEFALPFYGHDATRHVSDDIYARRLLSEFFQLFGVTSYYLPGLIVVAVLLGQHFYRRDPFLFRPTLYLMMAIESVGYAFPLFVFLIVLASHLDLQAFAAGTSAPALSWQARMVFSIGAGIYEEMLFRLLAVALIYLITIDIMGLPKRVGVVCAIGISAVLFALYHFSDRNPFDMGKFIQLTVAGVYLACVYVLRGFGVVVGTHAAYDAMVVIAYTLEHRD
ncbi:MAG: CPBP family intramembrane metalloprotease [Planctomycetota bacterium]|nr:CPBP family intramembrane metalloprotease [Planctomycetota bacterium]